MDVLYASYPTGKNERASLLDEFQRFLTHFSKFLCLLAHCFSEAFKAQRMSFSFFLAAIPFWQLR